MEDWDNTELPDYDRDEQLMDAVKEYNEAHGTDYKPAATLRNYKSIQREKQYEQ
jgi:hypothetical protein